MLQHPHQTRNAVQTWKETSPPSPERLDEDLPTSAKPGAAPGRAQPAPLLRRSGPNTKRFGGQSEQLPAAAGAPLNSPAHGACYRRLPEAEEGGDGDARRGARTQAADAKRPLPGRPPASREMGPPRPGGFRGLQGSGCPTDAPGAAAAAAAPSPARPARTKPPALTGSLSPSSAPARRLKSRRRAAGREAIPLPAPPP